MKNTNKALFSSVVALILCCSMLVGSTFAWFTDSASSAVNTIQAGNLDIVLEYQDANGNWVDAEGETLNFIAADNRTDILWEPGCTYKLPELRITNKGNLALKYDVVVNGINGDAKLLEAIEFTLSPEEGTLLPGASVAVALSGHMKEEAGNEYQGLKIEGIGITVYATQDTVEADSYDNQYDVNAEMPGRAATTEEKEALVTAITTAEEGSTIYLDALNYGTIELTYLTLPKNITIIGDPSARISINNGSGTAPNYNRNNVTGWTFKNVIFTGEGLEFRNNSVTVADVKDLTLINCVFETGANLVVSGDVHENIVIQKCKFYNTDPSATASAGQSAIMIYGSNGVTIEGCTFSNPGYNAVQLPRDMTGAINIKNNVIDSTASRAMRIVTKDGAVLNISGNVMTNSDNANAPKEAERGQIVKISGVVVNGTFDNNTHDGNVITFDGGIAK